MPFPVKKLNEQFERLLHRYSNRFFIASLLLFILVSAFLFEAKLFMMGDDADYLLDAFNFIHHNVYPSLRASLYGMVLGLVMLITGPNIILLKLFSFCCAIVWFCLLYRVFRNRIPYWLLFAMLFFTAVNSLLLYFCSSNLSEMFFMMMQGIFFHAAFTLIDKQAHVKEFRKLLPNWLYVGFAGLLISLSKNIALVAPLCLCAYFLFKKEYRNALLGLSFFALFKIPYELLLRAIYGQNTMVSQSWQIWAKDLYHPERGSEDFVGFLKRMPGNAEEYFSDNLVNALGLKFSGIEWPAMISYSLIIFILLFAFWQSLRLHRFLFFTAMYLAGMIGTTFLALQPDVAQLRIIIIYLPFLFALLLYGLIEMSRLIPKQVGLFFVAGLCLFCILSNVRHTVSAARDNYPVLRQNVAGNTFYGYTPDWVNYLEMGRYVKQHIPDSIVVAARKPNSLTFYLDGRRFFGFPALQDNTPSDTVLQRLKDWKIRYCILASLRRYPDHASDEIIYTIHSYIDAIKAKYPEKVKHITTIGSAEPCELVEIVY